MYIGLQVRLTDSDSTDPEQNQITAFDFSWAKFNQSPRVIEWCPLSLNEVMFPHIRLHYLKDDKDNLGEFLSVMNSIPSTLAVILINTHNNFRRSDTCVHTIM